MPNLSNRVPLSPSRLLRVVVISGEGIVAGSLSALLRESSDLQVIGTAATREDLVRLLRQERPTVIAVVAQPSADPDLWGSCLPELRSRNIGIVVVSRGNEQELLQLLNEGVCGYLLVSSPPEYVHAAVVAASHGEKFLDPTFHSRCADLISGAIQEIRSRTPADSLSQREREVLGLIAEGLSNKEIAAKLFISVKTAEAYRQRLRAKLDLHSGAEMIRYAVGVGLLKRFLAPKLPRIRQKAS
jgi:two-component system response regulator NreC